MPKWPRSRWRIPAPDVDLALARTRADRDRVIDLLRAWSISVVVAGHAVMAVVVWRDSVPRLGNTLASYQWLQPATWILQVLPIFFMVGATANGYSWDSACAKRTPYPTWIWHRTQRLLRPVIPYVAVMAGSGFLIGWLGDPRTAAPLLTLTTQLLWFLGAYLWVTAATPWFIRLRDTGARSMIVALMCTVALVDYLRLVQHVSAVLGLINFLAVWMLAGVLGVHLGRPLPAVRALTVVVVGLAANVLLVGFGPYPVSLVGMPGEDVSNMDPPTLVLVVHTFVLFAAISLLRPWLARLAARPNVWRATVAVNMLMMTIYLWHLPVLTALTFTEHALGWERPTVWDDIIGPSPAPGFWLWTALHLGAFGLGLLLTIRITWTAEYAKLPWWDTEATRSIARPKAAAVVAIALLGLGISVISAAGLVGFPLRVVDYEGVPFNSGVAALMLLTGVWLLRRAGHRTQASADITATS